MVGDLAGRRRLRAGDNNPSRFGRSGNALLRRFAWQCRAMSRARKMPCASIRAAVRARRGDERPRRRGMPRAERGAAATTMLLVMSASPISYRHGDFQHIAPIVVMMLRACENNGAC